MATIGKGVYATAVHAFFDGIRNYDLPSALAVLADDADLQSPWGNARGKDAIQSVLGPLVAPSMRRPSFTIADLSGDGHVTTLSVSMSGRFGKAPVRQAWRVLHLHGKVHHIVIDGDAGDVLAAPEPEPEPEPEAETDEAPAAVSAAYLDFKGDVDDIIDIEGIGPKYAEALKAAGIETTARLCYESVDRVAEITGAPAKTAAGWKSMAELMKIPGVGGQYAESLYRGGVTGIVDFQGKDAKAVADAINAYFDGVKTTVQKNKITEKRVAGWLEAAKAMKPEEQPVPAA